MLLKHKLDRATLIPKPSQTETTMRLSRILVPVDFSAESKNALRYAAAFAQQFGASVTLVHVVKPVICSADFVFATRTVFQQVDVTYDHFLGQLSFIVARVG